MSSAMTELGRWLRAVPPPPAPVDWALVESGIGSALPSDYKEFCDRFGGCRIQRLFVHAPGGQRTISDGQTLVEGFFDLPLFDYREDPDWPDYRGLLLWAEINSYTLLCWDRNSSDNPDSWRSVVFNTVADLVWLDGNMTTCIRDMITGRQRPEILLHHFNDPELWVSIRGQHYLVDLDGH
jgi:hypothetical protein